MRRSYILHPFLFAAYPALFLFAQNLEEQVTVRKIYLPLTIVLGGTAVLFLLAWVAFRDAHKGGLLTSAFAVLFFSYGHVANAISISADMILGVWAVMAVAVVVVLAVAGRPPKGLTAGLNLVALALVVINLVPIVRYEMGPQIVFGRSGIRASAPGSTPKRPPDIYYLIFDRYAGEQTLSELYGYSNSRFIAALQERGFYVAHDSKSNYPRTAHSLASSLSMSYLDELSDQVGEKSGDWGALYSMLQDFKVARILKSLGYRYVHLGTWWEPTREDPSADINFNYDSLSEFSSVLLDTTVLRALSERFGSTESVDRGRRIYETSLYQFGKLEDMPSLDGPNFVFAHVSLPHPPYVFDSGGDYVSGDGTRKRSVADAYLDQLAFTNRRILQLVDRLLDAPEKERPVIVLQADEGPHPRRFSQNVETFRWPDATDVELLEKFGILNAYYLPGPKESRLYESITPVNTFRLILSRYFEMDLPLIEDRNFVYEYQANLYEFFDITDRLSRRSRREENAK